MLDKLKNIYPSLITYDQHLIHDKNYNWFTTNQNIIFGIHQKELKAKDKQLLEMFFQTYNTSLPLETPTEKLWLERIRGNNETQPKHPFRFIYFKLPNGQMSAVDFSEALHTLFDYKYPILWENDIEGVIIEEIPETSEAIDFEKIIDILMNDLSVNVRFFIGSLNEKSLSIQEIYERTIETGSTILHLTDHHVMHYMESFPYLLLAQLSEDKRVELSKTVLHSFIEDQEMLETLHNYFYYNLNISETAKNMYMHRNSIQYRIDKFIKETNINIHHFNEAVSVKLAMLAKTLS